MAQKVVKHLKCPKCSGELEFQQAYDGLDTKLPWKIYLGCVKCPHIYPIARQSEKAFFETKPIEISL